MDGFESHPHAFALGADLLDNAVQVRSRFDVDDDDVGSRFGEIMDKSLRVLDHQVALYGHGAIRADCSEHNRTDRDVGHVMAVHDVHLDTPRPGLHSLLHLLAQPGEVG